MYINKICVVCICVIPTYLTFKKHHLLKKTNKRTLSYLAPSPPPKKKMETWCIFQSPEVPGPGNVKRKNGGQTKRPLDAPRDYIYPVILKFLGFFSSSFNFYWKIHHPWQPL